MLLKDPAVYNKKQIFSSVIANFLAFLVGIAIASSSVVIARLTDGEDEVEGGLKITHEEGSWIASSLFFGQIFSCFINGYLIEKIGPRRSMSVAAIIFTIGLIGQASAYNVILISVSRAILGMANMISCMTIQPFVCEISNPELRSLTTTFWLLSYSLGFSTTFVLGALLPWRLAVGLPSVIAVAALIGFQFIHDSPARLLLRNKLDEARKAADFYGMNYKDELLDMEKHQNKIKSIDDDNDLSDGLLVGKLRKFWISISNPIFYKPMNLLFVMAVSIEWSSFPILGFYMVTIFKLTGSPIDPYWASSVAAATRLVAAITATGVLSRFKRRQLYLSAAFNLSILHFLMGLYTYLNLAGYFEDVAPEFVKILEWTPLILVMLIYVDFAMGYGNIPFILLGEILPQESCSLGNTLVFISTNTFSFTMTKTCPAIIDAIGIYGLFFIFASVAFFAGVFASIFMPETKGLTLKEIRQIYDWNCCPEDLAMIEKLDATSDDEEELKMIKWAGAGGRRRTISITI